MKTLLRRLRFLVQSRRHDQELADELEFHREMAQAEGRAASSLGNSLLLREESREAWGWMWIDRCLQDLRYASRVLVKSPGFTIGAILMLAIGIGVNVAAFSFFNVIVLRPLPVRDPHSLVRFDRRSPQQYWSDLPYPAAVFYREHSRTLSAVIASNSGRLSLEDTNGSGRPVRAQFTTTNYFTELGATAAVGRLFDSSGTRQEPTVVLGHPFWKTHFGGDPGVVNRTLRLNGKVVTVLGVASPDFSGLTMLHPDFWVPIEHKPTLVAGSKLLTDFAAADGGVDLWGRLRPSISAKAAEAELTSLAAELRKQQPDHIWAQETIAASPGGFAQNSGGTTRSNIPPPTFRDRLTPVFALMGTLMFLILAVACSNLGSLLLSRGVARQRELSIRASVGAGRGRLVRQLLTESLLLASLGTIAGIALGYVVLRFMVVWTDTPQWVDFTPDLRVIAFAIGLGFIASILFGLAPALQTTRPRPMAGSRLRHLLIATQVTASCVLLIVAGLLVRGIKQVTSSSPGFEYQQVTAISPRLSTHGYDDVAARNYVENLANQLRALSGVDSVSVTATPPLGNRQVKIHLDGPDQRSIAVSSHRIEPGFFATMRIPLLAGRTFNPGETNAVIVSRSFAQLCWPDRDNPLGQTLDLEGTKWNVVGIAANARLIEPQDSDAVELYRPIRNADMTEAAILVKVTGAVDGFAPFVASIAKTLDPEFVPEMETLTSAFERKLEGNQRTAAAAGVLGGVSLLLACLGIAGTIAYAVSQRTKEIGIRMALGSNPAGIAWSVVHRFFWPVFAGLFAGVAAAAMLSKFLRGYLYGLSHHDPVAYAAALTVFVMAALLAAALPLRRALRVDPLLALRAD